MCDYAASSYVRGLLGEFTLLTRLRIWPEQCPRVGAPKCLTYLIVRLAFLQRTYAELR